MRAGGQLPEDGPDPRLEAIEQLRQLPIPIHGLVAQPHLEEWPGLGSQIGTGNGEIHRMTAVVSYTLWRNPADRTDPANYADLTEQQRAVLDAPPGRPRPPWLIEHIERMRYPALWEAVRTTWNRREGLLTTPAAELVDHVNHLIRNGIGPGPRMAAAAQRGSHAARELVEESAVTTGVPVTVDGLARPGVRIDGLAQLVGIGAGIGGGGVVTAVVPRDVLGLVTLELAAGARP